MKFINIKWVFLFVLVYALAIIVTVPISYLLPSFQPLLTQAGVSVQSAEGSLWRGESRVTHRQLGAMDVTWHTQPAALLLLRLPVAVSVVNPNLALSAEVIPSVTGVSVKRLSGFVDDRAAQPWLQPNQIELNGRLQLVDVNASSSWGLKLGEASGEATWSGGAIKFPVGRQIQNYNVPMMFGTLSSNDIAWVFNIDGNAGERFIEAALARDGLASLSVKRDLAEAMSLPLPAGGRSLFDISQQVF